MNKKRAKEYNVEQIALRQGYDNSIDIIRQIIMDFRLTTTNSNSNMEVNDFLKLLDYRARAANELRTLIRG